MPAAIQADTPKTGSNEENWIAEEERRAHANQARRAREQLEFTRENEIRVQRRRQAVASSAETCSEALIG
jgi:hypothetical protein